MTAHTLFVADIHLQPDESHPINQAFYHFLQTEARQAESLYILGDLFEMWVGDDIGLESYSQAIEALNSLSQHGTKIYLLFGNRDFLMRKQFWKSTGIHLIKDGTEMNLYGHKLVLMHGDTLCTDDIDYQKARRWLRNPVVMWLFLKLPKKKRWQIGQKMRQQSKRLSQNKASNIMDVNPSAVTNLFEKQPHIKHLIHGHTHRPAYHKVSTQYGTRHRWVLGDWRAPQELICYYLEANAAGLNLKAYPEQLA